MSDPRQGAIERAVRGGALALLERRATVEEVVASLKAAMGEPKSETTPRELAAAGRKAHRDKVIAQIVQLEKDGRGRAATSIVARMHAADPLDPIEIESLRRKFHRWRHPEIRTPVRMLGSR
jgi:hypothetical protein